MRVICLVPSLTETLLECGVSVVGRTRFCIHPGHRVADIEVVGGTKDIDWTRCSALGPDLVVLDREENTREMADSCPFPWTAVQITAVEDVGPELRNLAARVESDELLQLATDWDRVSGSSDLPFSGWHSIPGAQAYLPGSSNGISRLEYVIWRKPWMAIGPGTFILSILQRVGFGEYLRPVKPVQPVEEVPPPAGRYRELIEADMNRSDTFYLFSSEPYPFAEKRELLESMGVAGAIVDGERYSWYGVRSYRFLEALTGERPLTA